MKYRNKYAAGDNIKDIILDINGVSDSWDRQVIVSAAEYERMLKNVPIDLGDVLKYGNVFIYGDHDADGLTATAIAKMYTGAECTVLQRSSGHAFNYDQIKGSIGKDRTILVLDCGINDHKAIAEARRDGHTVIVVDHHRIESKTDGIVNIHPELCIGGFHEYSGSGMTYKLMVHLFGNKDGAIQNAAIGTVCDVMPIVDENRKIVRDGLADMNKNPLPNIAALRVKMDKRGPFTEQDLGWTIGPMINSCARTNNIQVALDWFLSDNMSVSYDAAEQMIRLNEERKKTSALFLRKAEESGIVYDGRCVIAVVNDLNPGYTGLIAQQLGTDRRKPAIVISVTDDSISASCRSMGAFDCNSLADYCADHLSGSGGHKGASGMRIKPGKVSDFYMSVIDYSETIPVVQEQEIVADLYLDISDIPLIYEDYISMAPFGQRFRKPIFVSEFKINKLTSLGQTGTHAKFTNKGIDCMGFGMMSKLDKYETGTTIRSTYEIESPGKVILRHIYNDD